MLSNENRIVVLYIFKNKTKKTNGIGCIAHHTTKQHCKDLLLLRNQPKVWLLTQLLLVYAIYTKSFLLGVLFHRNLHLIYMLILQTYTQKFKIHNPTLHARHILPSELTLLLLPELCLHTTCKSEAAHTYFGPILAHTGTRTLSPTVLSELRERVNIHHTGRLSLFNLFHQMKFYNKKRRKEEKKVVTKKITYI